MNYEIVIIGFGKGGKTLAAKLAAQGKKIALIEEDEKMYGGTCINVGCIPSKSLVKSSLLAQKEVSWNEKQEFYRKAILEEKELTAKLRQKNYEKLKSFENINLYLGKASFVDEKTIKIQGKEEITLNADTIFINTGAKAFIPEELQSIKNNARVFTSKELMSLEKLPQKLLIIGGGHIALEFASMYSAFGSKVVVVQRGEQFLPDEDKDLAECIFESLKSKGIDFQFKMKFEKIEESGDKSILYFQKENQSFSFECDAVLIATGRTPNTQNLHCEKAGIDLDKKGAVIVNEKLQTNKNHIYALGDVNGGLQFTYISLDDFRVVYAQMNQKNYTTSQRKNIPFSTFISPCYSKVGLNETKALAQGYEIKIAKLPAMAIPKAQVLQKTQGLLKIIINAKNDEILGAMLFCEESYEMINLIKLAMDCGVKYQILRDQIYTHPTMSESFNDLFDI